jgi:hypothetical protein
LSVLALRNTPSGLLIAKCFKGCARGEIHRAIDGLLQEGHIGLGRAVRAPSVVIGSTSEQEQVAWAARVWHSCQPIHESLAEQYLRNRGITLHPLPAALRFHPNLAHKPSDQRWPAMVALVQTVTGQPIAVHRTWLSRNGNGKAPVEPNRMTLGPVSGSAIRLAEATDTVVIAEGIETALSVTKILGNQPVWASLSTSGMKAVHLPPSIRSVTIAADHDGPGLQAAQSLCRRLETEGRSVTMIKPNRENADFNDLLAEEVR